LDAFATPDPEADVRAVFSWSYRRMSPAVQSLFRRLAIHLDSATGAAAAASLAGVPLGRARDRLAELTQAHLLTASAPDRFALHLLLRAYAAELGRTADSQAEHVAALRRLLDHYLHTAVPGLVIGPLCMVGRRASSDLARSCPIWRLSSSNGLNAV
jgi:hypothetical protein